MNSLINRAAFGITIVLVVAWGLSGSAIAAEHPANQTEINLESISAEDGSINVAEEEKVNLSQDELVVESGETVVIESRNTTTPTDFVIHKNGTLRIKNSDIFMTGEFHHDNYFDVSGTLILSNSTINGTHGALPGILVWSSNSEVRIDNSTVKGNVGLKNGEAVIENASVGAAFPWLDPSKNLTFIAHNSSFETITMGFSHFSQQIEFHNLSSNITNYALHIEGNDLNISNSIIQKSISLDFREKNPEGEKANYLITNSTDTGITAHPGTNTTIKDSKLFSLYLKHVHSDDTFTYSNVSPGHFTNKSLIDKSNFAVNLENTTVSTKSPDGVSSGLNLVAQGMSARMIIRDSTLGEAKIGRYLNASNISVGAFQIYNSHGGSFHFDNSTVMTFAGVKDVNATVTGNLSIGQSGPEYFVQRWGGLRLLNLTRQYPVDLSNIASLNPDGEQIHIMVQNPNETKIENTSYTQDTEIVFPEVRYNLSNYNQSFTLTIRQGNRSTSLPLMLTTDTPIEADELSPDNQVNLSQDLLIVESGETVVIENRNTTTPTNFSVNEGGTLIIRNSTLFRIGEHHNDNEDYIKGELRIENSTLKAEYGVPIEKVISSPQAKILVKNSDLGRIGNRLGVTIFIQSGATVDIRNSNVSMVNGYIANSSDSQNLTITRSKLNNFGLSIVGAGGESFTITNLTKSVESLHLSKANSKIMFSNVTIENPPYVASRISKAGESLLNVRVVNSSVRPTVWSGSNFTAIQSEIYNPNVKFDALGKEKYAFSDLQRGTKGFKDGYLLNHSDVKIHLINSSVPLKSPPRGMYKGLKINNPGGGHNSGDTDIQITNSSVYVMKIGHNLTATNTSATYLMIYNNYGGVFEFNDVNFGPPGDSLQVTEGANVEIRGNVSFYGGVINPGGSRYFNITRHYPVNISALSHGDSEEEIRVLVITPKGTEIENTSYNPNTEYVIPEVRYNLSNYNQSFTLTIQQGNRSTSRPLTLTTDTPIQIHDEPFLGLNVTAYTAEPMTVPPGQNVTITATVENEGNITDEMTVRFYADGEAFDNETVKLAGGENTTVSTSTNFAEAGTHTVSVNGLPETEIQIQVAEKLWVGPDQDYATIQSAVDAAKAGNTVIVYPGTYTESVNIPNSITLRAARNATDTVIVDAGDSGGVVTLNANGTRVDGFTLTNPGHAYGGVRVFSDENVVTNTTFADMGTDIVFGSDAKENHFYLNTFENGAKFFYLGAETTPRANHWNTTQQKTYWYQGEEFTGRLGNYHSDYDGQDTDGDGIGETPYQIGPNNTDYYLLVAEPGSYLVESHAEGVHLIGYQVLPRTATVNETVRINATVENTGDLSGEETVRFYADGTEFANKTVEVDGGNSTTVTATTTFSEAGAHTVTVNDLNATDITVQSPANLTVSDLTAPSSAVQGETITVTANITNTGMLLGNGSVQFAIDVDDNGIWGDDGDVVLSEEVSVPGEETTQVEFEVDTTDLPPGTYDHQVTVDESSMSGEITIEEPAFFAVSDLQPPDYVAEHDEVFTVNATVENTGDLSATKTVELRLDGETVANKSVELDAGNSTTVEFVVDASEIDAGEYNHSVWTEDEGVEGTLTVEPKAPIVVDDPANDLDDDGKYEDVNGDGEFNIVDVQALYANHDSDVVQTNVDLFDFNDDGEVNLNDVQALYTQI